ncbi:MAG: choice-of-anchor D domain-containing protein [Verrucomicrobiales bacterium]|nr:choice-of-anchor D domain-containing protein [Verrucomicrobiales bacterium]
MKTNLLSHLLTLIFLFAIAPLSVTVDAQGDKLLNAANLGLGAPNDLDPYFVDFDRARGIAALSSGNVVVCWRERDNTSSPVPTPDSPDGSNGKGYACFFRVYGPTGTVITAATRPYLDINADGTGDQNTPMVAALGGGGFVITWNSVGGPGDTYDLGFTGGDAWGRVYDNSGAAVSGIFHVNDNDPNGVPDTQEPVSVVGLSGGGFAILWEDGNDNAAGLGANDNTDDLFLRAFNANGTPAAASTRLGGIGQDSYFKDFQQFGGASSGLVALSNGSVAVGWAVRDKNNDGTGASPDGVAPNGGGASYFQIFDSAGVAVNSPTTAYLDINPDASGSQLAPSLTPLTGGGLAVLWNSNHNTNDGGNSDVGIGGNGTSGGDTYTRVYTNAGVAVSATSRVNDLRADDSETPAAAVPLSDGGFAIVWKEDDDNTAPPLDNTDDYYARAYNANGTPRNPSVLIGGAAADPLFEDIAQSGGLVPLSDGGFAVGLRVRDSANNGTGTSFDGIAPNGGYAATVQLFNANGTTRTAPFFPYADINADFSGNQNIPILCSNVGGGLAVTWHSNFNTNDTDNDLPVPPSPSTSNGGDTYTRIYDNSGVALHGTVQAHGEGLAEPTGTIDQQDPFSIIGLTGGNYAIVVRDDNDNTSNKDDLFISIFEGVPASGSTAPEIAVYETVGGGVADGGSFGFGSTPVGTSITKTFTITNSGTANLTLSNLVAPSGFTVAQNFGSTTVAPAGGTTTFQITMTAAAVASPSGTLSFVNNDTDENPYNFTISGTVAASTNANLAVISTTGGALSPGFSATVTSYSTPNVSNTTASVTVTATTADANATMQVRVNGGGFAALSSGVASGSIALNVGANAIDAKVTAQDGSTTKTYSIAVFRVTNNAPTVANPIVDQVAVANNAFSLTFAANTFNEVDSSQTLSYSATGVPTWLTFTPSTRTFSGTPLVGDVGTITITVTATDDGVPPAGIGESFDIVTYPAPPLPLTPSGGAPAGLVSGNIAPDMPGQSFSGFFDYTLSSTGHVLAHMNTAGAAGISADAGVFSDATGSLDLLARESDAMAPGVLSGAFFDFRLTNSGKGFFVAKAGGAGVTSANDYIGLVDDGLAVNGYAREGTNYATLSRSLAVQTGGENACFPGTLLVGGAVTAANDTGIFLVNGSTATSSALAQEGTVLTGLVKIGTVSSRVVVSANGAAVFQAALTGTPILANGAVLKQSLGGGGPAIVAQKGGNVPGVAGATFSAFAGESVGPAGDALIEATMKTDTGLGINTTNDEGLWIERGGSLELVIREGDTVADAELGRVDRHWLLTDGTVVVRGVLKGGTVGAANDVVVFTVSPLGGVNVLLREGDAVAALGSSEINALSRFDISPGGEWVSMFTLTSGSGDATSLNNIALIKGALGTPAPSIVLRKGTEYFYNGSVKTMYGFLMTDNVANTAGGSGGHGAAVNDGGTMAAGLYFSDGTQGIFVGP